MAEVADAITDECLTDVITTLKQHVDDGGTICLAADCQNCFFYCQMATQARCTFWLSLDVQPSDEEIDDD